MKLMTTKKGFTLVEIMIVVAIIGLLAAIAIPNLLRARINANDAAVQGDLRAFSTAAETFFAAQNPNSYAADAGAMSAPAGGGPAYIDTTWNAATGGTLVKHGHTLTYVVDAANGSSYSMHAVFIQNQSVNDYCIDQTGVLYTETAAATGVADATGCATNWTAVVS
jgi:type IV pilus assembly protein PilA